MYSTKHEHRHVVNSMLFVPRCNAPVLQDPIDKSLYSVAFPVQTPIAAVTSFLVAAFGNDRSCGSELYLERESPDYYKLCHPLYIDCDAWDRPRP